MAQSATPSAPTPSAPTVVWTEIPVTDLSAAQAFYEKVFGWQMDYQKMEPNDSVMFRDGNGIHGHLYPGKPASEGQGPTLHLALADTVEAGAARCIDAGGTVLGPVIEIPPGRFQYAQDPDGNSLGLFEPKRG